MCNPRFEPKLQLVWAKGPTIYAMLLELSIKNDVSNNNLISFELL